MNDTTCRICFSLAALLAVAQATRVFAADTADEDAAKIGAEYSFPPRTKVMAVFENLHRYVPSFLEFQNERQRTGTWLAVSQEITGDDSIYAGWAHAGRTPGDPGQHNTSLILPPLGSPGDATGGADVDNAADMLTFAYKHNWGSGLSNYVNLAGVFNGPYAHYAMGPCGRAVTIDGHDAFSASGGTTSAPHCWAGGQILGVSSGLKYQS